MNAARTAVPGDDIEIGVAITLIGGSGLGHPDTLVALIDADGQAYEIRNRMTLCCCGRSQNRPFCNGAHAADLKFRDGLC